MKKHFIITLILGIFYFTLSPLSFCQNAPSPYSPQIVSEFAQDLFQTGFWDEAEAEYKRSLFLWDTSDNGDRVNCQILPDFEQQAVYTLASIYNSKKNVDGIQWLSNNYSQRVDSSVREKIDIVTGRFIFLTRDAASFSEFTSSIKDDLDDYDVPFQMLTLICTDILNKDISSANIRATTAAREMEVFSQFAQQSAAYNTKSPALATILSIFIPGSGKWYTGSFSAFFSSFLTISSFIAGTVYTGIESGWKDWRPYVFGTAALIFYSADIYGSYQSALRYNDSQMRHLYESLDVIYEQIF